MKEFDYEVLQRKRLASQAKYRKNGSKSKKCSLPSDGMSHKEWKERNGEVMTYNLSKPMSWERFKSLPKDIQAQYIEKLQTEFGASLSGISVKMFGLSASCLRGYLVGKGIPFNADKCRRSEASVERFKQFCNGETEPEATHPQPADGAEPEKEEANTCTIAVCKNGGQEAVEPPRKTSMTLDTFTLQFSGEFDPDAIRNSLAMILQRGQRVSLQISCRVEG